MNQSSTISAADPHPPPERYPDRAGMLDYLRRLATHNDLRTATMAQENGQIILTAQEWSELHTLAAQAPSPYSNLFPDPPAPISTDPPAPTPYPIPHVIAAEVSDLMAVTGCTDRVAAAMVMSSWNALAQQDYDARGLVDRSTPISLFFFIGEDTGTGKSTASELAFHAHEMADEILTSRWVGATASAAAEKKNNKMKPAPEPEPESEPQPTVSLFQSDFLDHMDYIGADREPTAYEPSMLSEDTTTENLLTRLRGGRRTQISLAAEATTVMENFSFQGSNRGRALSALCKAYGSERHRHERVRPDVENVHLRAGTYRFALCWAAQPDPARDLIFSPEANRGFAARCLVSISDTKRRGAAPKDVATPDLDRMQKIIARERNRQDDGAEYQRPLPALPYLGPTPEAKTELEKYEAMYLDWADGEERPHARGYWRRAAQTTHRIAATLRAIRLYQRQTQQTAWDLDDVGQAAAITSWHGHQLSTQADAIHTTEWARLAKAVTDALPQAVHWTPTRGRPADGYSVAIRMVMGQGGARGLSALKGNPDAREWVIRTLESHGWIAKIPGGRYAVNPHALQ